MQALYGAFVSSDDHPPTILSHNGGAGWLLRILGLLRIRNFVVFIIIERRIFISVFFTLQSGLIAFVRSLPAEVEAGRTAESLLVHGVGLAAAIREGG